VFAQIYQTNAILYIAVIFSLGSALFSYYFADSITLAVSKAQLVDRASNQQLYNIVENLCIAAGIPTPKIYIINDSAPNAFATGRDPQHAVICYTTGILQKLDKTEIEGVTAHELSHIGNYDIRLMTLVVVLVGTITLLGNMFLRFGIFGGGRRSNKDGNLGMILFCVGILLAILSPIIATLIKLAVSRQREYLADASGALLTRYPEGLARALEKISDDQQPLAEANNATAHLYIVNPFHEDRSGQATADHPEKPHGARAWLAGLFNTHPPIEDRVKRLREMNL
jgi:heat shock protein HtpX